MVDVKTIIEESQEKMDMAVMYLEEALAHIRAGKASTRLLDGIRVTIPNQGPHQQRPCRNHSRCTQHHD